MAAMVATMATKNDTSPWRADLRVAVVTSPPFPRPAAAPRQPAIYRIGCQASTSTAEDRTDSRGPTRSHDAGSLLEQCWRQLPPLGERQLARVGGQDLDADVVCAGGMVCADPLAQRPHVSPRHDGVHETVAAAVAQVVVSEAQRAEVPRIVRQA